ncbi:MAG: glycosyltransferase family 4 protein [Phycisphaeraceae bacterium]|nr:glycosyltransferase family 4 protein [Bacteroidota bacterium]MCW5768125.1 glycosyltransferase family 4 protein [Phycisphaeraceae bacterium]
MTEPVIINATNLGKYIDGLGVYTLNLIRELAQLQTDLRFIIYVNKNCREHIRDIRFSERCELRWVSSCVSPDYRFRGHLMRLLFSNILSLMHKRSLIFVSTQLEALFFHKNQIVTIHDIIPLLFKASHRKQYFYYKYLLGFALRKAKSVITPSQHTKDLLLKHYQLTEAQVRVIHNGVRQSLQVATEMKKNSGEKYILFTGRLVGMKNVEGLLRAFCLIKDEVPHRLIMTGHGTRRMKHRLRSLCREGCGLDEGRVVYRGHVSSEEMEELLNKASLLVFPSFYEGFGFPPLEGMTHGCPVVVSNVSCLPEVCADAALYVDPYDVQSIAGAMRTMLTDAHLRQLMIVRGVERAQHFRWDVSARLHVEAFSEVLHA